MQALCGRAVVVACLVGASASVPAAEIHRFDDPALDARFRDLTFELRCLVCQNQNIADSDAELARDLRHEVDRMLREGQSDAQIKDFMVERYGEFVLYRPRLRAGTVALWVGPFVLAASGLLLLGLHVRRSRARGRRELELDERERARVAALLGATERDGAHEP